MGKEYQRRESHVLIPMDDRPDILAFSSHKGREKPKCGYLDYYIIVFNILKLLLDIVVCNLQHPPR